MCGMWSRFMHASESKHWPRCLWQLRSDNQVSTESCSHYRYRCITACTDPV
jgi:hypothetical protein